MYVLAHFNFGYTNKENKRIEWWNVYINNKLFPVCLTLDPEWIHESASINDIRQLAINEAKKQLEIKDEFFSWFS